jgi:hypothetical protein
VGGGLPCPGRRLLNVVDSLDTPVRHVETHRWEKLRSDVPEGARVTTLV